MNVCMGDTRGAGVLSSTGDVLEMSVVKSVCGVFGMYLYLSGGGVGGEGGEWMRGLGLGFTTHMGTRGVLDVCLGFGCGGVVGVGGESVEGLCQDREEWGRVMLV